MKLKVRIFIILLLFANLSQSQTTEIIHSIRGTVIDKEYGFPLENVKVNLFDSCGTKMSYLTDTKGKFYFDSLDLKKCKKFTLFINGFSLNCKGDYLSFKETINPNGKTEIPVNLIGISKHPNIPKLEFNPGSQEFKLEAETQKNLESLASHLNCFHQYLLVLKISIPDSKNQKKTNFVFEDYVNSTRKLIKQFGFPVDRVRIIEEKNKTEEKNTNFCPLIKIELIQR